MLEKEAYLKNVLSLAYLGDAVFSLMVREALVLKYNLKSSGLNKIANSVVCAKSQADIMRRLESLTDDEQDIVNRARNSHVNNIAKNSTREEYGLATEFEALVGYWYLTNKKEKLDNIFNTFVMEKL